MFTCLNCGGATNNSSPRYFVIPGHIVVPSEHYLCEKHKNVNYRFEDIYNNDGTRKKYIDHKKIRERE